MDKLIKTNSDKIRGVHISLGAVDVRRIFGTEKKLLFILQFMNYSFSKKGRDFCRIK